MKAIEQIEAQIADLQKQVEALKAKHKEWPQVDDAYWILNSNGVIEDWVFENDKTDKLWLSQGNAFRTQAEAEAERDARAVVAEVRKQPGRAKFDVDERNYYICVSFYNNDAYAEYCTDDASGFAAIFFDSEESVQAAIKAVGTDRILKAARWWACGEC